MTREKDPLWLTHRAERARRNADEAVAQAEALEQKAFAALREMEERWDRYQEHVGLSQSLKRADAELAAGTARPAADVFKDIGL